MVLEYFLKTSRVRIAGQNVVQLHWIVFSTEI